MCGWACAYCGDQIGRVGEDVEHFRPKDKYWFLAYSFDNYVSSCRPCNSKRKGNRFELEPGFLPAVDRQHLRGERRLLLDPVLDAVEDGMQIALVDNRYHWEVNPSAPQRLRLRAAYTIEFFRLNDDAELVKARSTAISDYLRDAQGTDEQRAFARLRASRYEPHGAAICSVIRRHGNQALLPGPDEELTWLTAYLIELYQIFAASARPDRKNWDLVRWALAALVASRQPGTTAGLTRTLIRQAGLTTTIDPFVKLLRRRH
jgi:uncharacterized protein (TIGR02646 family)